VNAPGDAGAGCETGEKVLPRARVWLSAATKVEFPPLARIGRLPDLTMTASGGFPFAGTDGNSTLVVPTPDRATLGAALTVVARLGVAAGRQIPFSFVTGHVADKPGHVLVVAPARARSGEHAASTTRPRRRSAGLVCSSRTIACRSLCGLARCLAKACV